MSLALLLLMVGSLSFLTAWLLISKTLRLQANHLKKEQLKARIGLSSTYTKAERSFTDCWWCSLGRAVGPKNGKEIQTVQQHLVSAGYRSERHIGAYFFIKYFTVLVAALLAVMLWSWFSVRVEFAIVLPLIALLAPERILIYLGNNRLAKISNNLPDFLDMCNICMNAGLSYLVAIKRVSQELKEVHPEICFEFEYLLDQIQMGMARTDALRQFAERNPTKDIENLVQVLIQNEKLGSSIGEALNEFSRRMYQDREQALEEKAAKTSAKMAIVIMPFMLIPYLILLLAEQVASLGSNF